MREKMLLVAQRIREVARTYTDEVEEALIDIARCIEDELADPVTFYVCASCGAKMASDCSYIEPHRENCTYRS